MKPSHRIRRRLTAWYAGSAFVLLLVTVLSMGAWSRRALSVQFEESVDRSVDLARSFFRAELSEYRAVDVTLSHISAELVFAGMGFEFLRPDSTVFSRARLGAAPLKLPLRVFVVPLDATLAPGWKLRLHVSVADLTSARRRIDQATLFALPLAVALAAIAGWLVTGRALQPVARMAEAAERITVGSASDRLPIADPDDELGRLGRRFNGLLDRLDGALIQQRRFLDDAAHELRTPLARMLGEAETQLSAPASAVDREALSRIHEDLGRASDLVDELVQLARADAGSAGAMLATTYLDDVVADAIAPWHAEANRRGIGVEIEELRESPASLDARLAARLLGVLLQNALQYTPTGGTVGVRVLQQNGSAVLEVHDSGIGIPVADRDRIFERFFRGTVARQRAPEGSGLGLAIAAWIAQQHGATISADQGPRGGALMRVVFPLVTTTPTPPQAPIAVPVTGIAQPD
ncbi:MAG: ATP-binding protein [Gemmatimonadaceae bacterium]|nr:ATP-binding protein [Gemmatimonadaceae bacterium]